MKGKVWIPHRKKPTQVYTISILMRIHVINDQLPESPFSRDKRSWYQNTQERKEQGQTVGFLSTSLSVFILAALIWSPQQFYAVVSRNRQPLLGKKNEPQIDRDPMLQMGIKEVQSSLWYLMAVLPNLVHLSQYQSSVLGGRRARGQAFALLFSSLFLLC